jgi:uncharacterized Tic20 family protein
VSDEDRDQVVEHVTTAYAEGRLDKVEFDERVDQAMSARTHADLTPIMTDLYGTHRVPTPQPLPPPIQASVSGDRLGAGAAHMLPMLGLSFVGPLIMLMTVGRTSPYVRAHAMEALNFQLTMVIATLVLAVTLVGILLIPFLWVAAFVLSIVGGVSGLSEGRFRYPLTIRMIK